MMTQAPARLIGLRDRGELRAGWAADVVLFDMSTVDRGMLHTRTDFPGGATRLYADAIGVVEVLVNGPTIVKDGQWSGATPGTLLRSGRDTRSRRGETDDR